MKQDFEDFHEEEKIILRAAKPIKLDLLKDFLLSLGFQQMDDFFFLKREDATYNWQSTDLIHLVAVSDKNIQLDLIENDSWNSVELDYLFATLPFECKDSIIDVVFKMADTFKLTVEHKNKAYSRSDLDMAFYEYREDVRNSLDGEPGSEIVRINIAMSYPRTK